MSLVRKIGLRLLLVSTLLTSIVVVRAFYNPTSRDTLLPPEDLVRYDLVDLGEFELLYSEGDLTYYYRESRDTIAIYDARSDYTWITGLDLEYNKDIDDDCDDFLDEYDWDEIANNADINLITPWFIMRIEDVADLLVTALFPYDPLHDDLLLGTEEFLSNLSDDDFAILIDIIIDENIIEDNYIMAELFANYSDRNIDNYFISQAIKEDDTLVTKEMILTFCRPIEDRLNTIYTGFANGLITIEYIDSANNIKRISSSSYEDVNSSLMTVVGEDNHFRLDVEFEEIEIEVSVHVYFDENGVRYEIRDHEVSSSGSEVLAAIIVSPFIGASGGAYEEFDVLEMDYVSQEIYKYRTPGYSFVPDGSGSLIRYNDNTVKLNSYESTIYGLDPNQNTLYYSAASSFVPFKTASMPVFGMAHGNIEAAFVAFATSGEEYMRIISMPDENLTYYNFTYPRFEYNKQYFQEYNKDGAGYFTTFKERNHFDIDIRYNFLAGKGETGFSADYVGMALSYREYLINEGILNELNSTEEEIPIRLDFFMSDVEKAITGYRNQVTTDHDGVRDILNDLISIGITNINSGLLGWNDGGVTLGDPRDTDFTREIGRESEFEDLIKDFNKKGIDISFSQDYYYINEDIMSLRRNASQHISIWYSRIETFNYPISMFYYARPVKSVEWMLDQSSVFDDLDVQSFTITGISNHLISDMTTEMTREESKEVISEGFADLPSDKLINAYQPNMYLWEYIDRFLGTPAYGSQFLIETDTVPFLQIVLNNTMELYAPYSNFSFYTASDVLRMIDYNIYPSFVLTYEPAHLLTDTNSRNYYSTEYILYEDLIKDIYNDVDNALGNVIGVNWINRTVLENGVIVNTYQNGVEIVINYTDQEFSYNGVIVNPISYKVIGG